MDARELSFAVMGTGGVGGTFGARLAAAGYPVTFIARGAHLAAIREAGLRLISPHGDLTIDPARATDDPAEIGPADVVLFAVKLYDTEAAGRALAPLVGEATAVLSLQNGVEAEAQLAAIVGPEHVMGGVAQIAAVIDSPGVIRHSSPFARIIFGELDGRRSPRAEALLAACESAAIDAHLSEEIETEIWNKFVFLATFSAVGTLSGLPAGAIQEDPDLRAVTARALNEAVAVGRAKGIPLDQDFAPDDLGLFDTLPPGMKSSMHQDLERGNRIEVEHLSGAVARMGAALGVATPVHHTVYAALKRHAHGRRGEG
jgi:2-dehydropantoate 2-reductase